MDDHDCYECGNICDCGGVTEEECDGCSTCFDDEDAEIADLGYFEGEDADE